MPSNFSKAIKRASPFILTSIGAAGVIFTSIAASKATLKANSLIKEKADGSKMDKKTILKLSWKCYIPTALIGIGTVFCIFGANALNKKQQAALSSAYILISNKYKNYTEKLKELYGEEAHKRILEEIEVKQPKDIYISTPNLTGFSSLDFDDEYETPILFYDSFSERYFESTISRVLLAEYYLNRNFSLGWIPSVNDFYDFLGLEHTDIGEQIGWVNANGEYCWIDFSHTKKLLDDGKTVCYVIDAEFPSYPVTDYICE